MSASSSTLFTLFCYIEGDPTLLPDALFHIEIESQGTISKLRRLIHGTKQKSFAGLDENELIIWKLNKSIPVDDRIAKEVERVIQNIRGSAVRYYPTDKLSRAFDSGPPAEGHVHIIVQKPVMGISRSSIEIDSPRPNKRVRPDFDGLLPNYGDAYLFWKRWWRSAQMDPGAAMDSDRNGDIQEHGIAELEPLFTTVDVRRDSQPRTTQYVSATCKVMEGHPFLPPPCQGAILFREEYSEVISYLEREAIGVERKLVILCGHLGIGKSICLFAILAHRLRQGMITILHLHKLVFLFHHEGVFQVQEDVRRDKLQRKYAPPGTWVLVDAEKDFRTPYRFVRGRSRFFIVLASSPQKMHWDDWMDEVLPAEFFYMKPWTWEELVQGRSMQEGAMVPSEEQLWDFYCHFGPSAREAYRFAGNPAYQQELERKTCQLGYEGMIQCVLQAPSHNLGTESHRVVLILPQSDDNRQEMVATFVSKYIYRLALRANSAEEGSRLRRDFYTRTLESFYAKAAAGLILEEQIHHLFPQGGDFRLLDMTGSMEKSNVVFRISHPTQLTWEHWGPRKLSMFSTTNDAFCNLDPTIYYQHSRKNYPSIDSFFFEDKPVARITLLHVTAGDVNASELDKVVAAIHQLAPPPFIRYICVCPVDSDTVITIPKAYQEYIQVFALEMSVNDLFPDS